VPHEVSFIKKVPISSSEQYINNCCIGGDVVVDHLLPFVRARYSGIQTNQEDWGWFIWFNGESGSLAIDVFTADPDEGVFRIRLTSRRKHLFFFEVVSDSEELDELRLLVTRELAAWGATAIKVDRVADL
jgi:hypothetical protein